MIDNMLIFDNGSFISPRVKFVFVAKNEQTLHDIIQRLIYKGVLEWN